MRSRAGGAGDLGPLWTAIRSLDPRSACPSRDGIQTGNVHRALRDSAHHWLVVAMAGNADRSRTEDCTSAAGLDRARDAGVRTD
jgi:hypothetical protein